jgi:hypothetical protein
LLAPFAITEPSIAQTIPAGIPVRDANGCLIFMDSVPDLHRTFRWSGSCAGGIASGPGTLDYVMPDGSLQKKITGTKNATGTMVGLYQNERFDSRTQTNYKEEGNLDSDGEQDGITKEESADPLVITSFSLVFSHGKRIDSTPFVVQMRYTPAGTTKYNSTYKIATYSRFEVGTDANITGEGTTESDAIVGSFVVTKTWVGQIRNGGEFGKGVYTYTNIQKLPQLNGMRMVVEDFDSGGKPLNSIMYGPNGAIWSRVVNGIQNMDRDAIDDYFNVSSDVDSNSESSPDDAAPFILSMFGMVLDTSARRAHGARTNLSGRSSLASATSTAAEQAMSDTFKWTAVAQTSSEKKQIEDAQADARADVSKTTADRCTMTCSLVFDSQSKRCTLNFGGLGQHAKPCYDMINDAFAQCKQICTDPLRIATQR